MSYASSSTSSNSIFKKYDVFLSFRGPDTRRTFVSHLYNALEQKNIHAFKDDERLETGKSIPDELLKSIKESRFAIVIFSKSYASSKWCLEELAHIIKCRKRSNLNVIPIFYDVSPSDVRHQKPPFAKSFTQHEKKCEDDMEKIERWRNAFEVAGKIAGHDVKNYKDDADCIKKLVDDIFPKLQVISPFQKSLVGMKSQIEKVVSLLDMESDDVRSIGIWGMGGIGKTELATSLYLSYCHQFDAHCFLGGLGASYQKNGQAWSEQVLIGKILGGKLTLTSEHEGLSAIMNMLHQKKVLFVLDDVNHQEQLEYLVGEPDWFGRGSRVILTARNRNLLISHAGDNVYEVQLLPENNAFELFRRHAFREKSPKKDFMELSSQMVEYAGGLPLALKVLGSSCYNRTKEQFRDIIDRLKKIPPNDILGKLRISYDGLDKDEKAIFLDTCSLHKDDSVDYVKLVLKSRGIQLIGIDYLVEKSLISISGCRIERHNLIREMGENILREEYTNSRIWLPEDVHELFAGKLKTEKLESLCIPKGYNFEDALVNCSEVFKRMQSLQVLKVEGETSRSDFAISDLPSSLRFIDKLICLKYLDLSSSLQLTKTPNFDDMPNLKTLSLRRCENLEEVDSSLGLCSKLTYLDLKGCAKLWMHQKFIPIASLEYLDLRGCTNLKEFPKVCGDMQSLLKLSVGSPLIRRLPQNFSSLTKLHLEDCEDLESMPDTIPNLKDLCISGCKNLATLPNSLFESDQLEELEISKCSRLVDLPISLGVHKKLKQLVISDCENLKKLPNSIQMESLEYLRISHYPKLDTFPEINGDMHRLAELIVRSTGIRKLPMSVGNLSGLMHIDLEGCEDLVSLPNSLCNLENLQWLVLCGCKKLEKLPENIGDLQMLEKLDASGTAISQPPPSIRKLRKLEDLNFSQEQLQHSSSLVLHQVSGLSSLKRLHLGNCYMLSGLLEDLVSFHSLECLNVRGSNISCIPKSIKELLCLEILDVQLCKNLNELPGELPPNLVELYADYHLALKSIRDLLKCVKLYDIKISWHGVSTNQVNVLRFIQYFLRAYTQCDFHQRRYFCISSPEVRIPESFGYQLRNQENISINLNPFWYTNKFMGFSICCYTNGWQDAAIIATLVCKFGPRRIHSLKCHINQCRLDNSAPSLMWFYIPFKMLWHVSENKEGKNPNDYCLFEVSTMCCNEACWGIRLEYESNVRRRRRRRIHRATQSSKLFPVQQNNNAVTTVNGCSMALEQPEPSHTSSSLQSSVEHNTTIEVNQATMAVQNEHESQNVELDRVCDSSSREMGDASRKRKRKRQRQRNKNKKGKTTSNYPTLLDSTAGTMKLAALISPTSMHDFDCKKGYPKKHLPD
ncbi:disease resistance protein Roq1-like [Lycium barbarum]|uniref:disease resistance protein Roq1-like n=1 Tax=Lycium barbarum TaxID=112863 RepID=UPI00293E3E3E|nr:disease resistance protein Roq1-like [Lycium barbarum]